MWRHVNGSWLRRWKRLTTSSNAVAHNPHPWCVWGWLRSWWFITWRVARHFLFHRWRHHDVLYSCSYKFLQIFFKNVLCLSKYFLLKFESNVCVLSFYSCVSGLCRLRRNDRLSCCSLPRLCSASSVNSAATTLAYNHSHTHTNKTRRAKCRLARLRSCCCEPRSLAEKFESSKTRRSTTRKQTSKIK